jgi:hypothetical protein
MVEIDYILIKYQISSSDKDLRARIMDHDSAKRSGADPIRISITASRSPINNLIIPHTVENTRLCLTLLPRSDAIGATESKLGVFIEDNVSKLCCQLIKVKENRKTKSP